MQQLVHMIVGAVQTVVTGGDQSLERLDGLFRNASLCDPYGLKTGALIRASVRMGARCGGASDFEKVFSQPIASQCF